MCSNECVKTASKKHSRPSALQSHGSTAPYICTYVQCTRTYFLRPLASVVIKTYFFVAPHGSSLSDDLAMLHMSILCSYVLRILNLRHLSLTALRAKNFACGAQYIPQRSAMVPLPRDHSENPGWLLNINLNEYAIKFRPGWSDIILGLLLHVDPLQLVKGISLDGCPRPLSPLHKFTFTHVHSCCARDDSDSTKGRMSVEGKRKGSDAVTIVQVHAT